MSDQPMKTHVLLGTLLAHRATIGGGILLSLAFVFLFGPAESHGQETEIESLLDPTFVPPQIPGFVTALAMQSDDKMLVASVQFTDGVRHGFLTRFDADGQLDLTFNPGRGPGADLPSAGGSCVDPAIL